MPKKICFVALRAYPLIAKMDRVYGGGPEVLQTILGSKLLEQGFEVSFVVYGSSSGKENIDGIDIIKVPYGEKSRILKSIFIWKAMKKACADIYYHHSGASPIVALFCGANKKKFILHIGSDGCLMRRARTGVKGYGTWWCDIKFADVIIVQTNFQKLMLKKNFNRDSFLIRNIFPVKTNFLPTKIIPPTVLWVGAIAHVKQPWLFLKLARELPRVKFQMIGGIEDDGRLYEFIKRESKKIPNLDMLGHIPFSDVDNYFEKAAILVNTSKFEGYPNAFVQSWNNYTPVVSLNADPDEVICKYELGFHSRTFEQVVNDVTMLLNDEMLRKKMSYNCKRYVEKEHNLTKAIDQYKNILSLF